MYYILKNMKPCPVNSQQWDAWHTALNRHIRIGDQRRILDQHALKKGDKVIELATIFQGMEGMPLWMTLIRRGSVADQSWTIGEAKQVHHEILNDLLGDGYELQPDYYPEHYLKGPSDEEASEGDAGPPA